LSKRALLADERTLASLDFPAIREQLARHTMSDRATLRARALTPAADIERIRLEQAATSEMRALVADAAFSLPRIIEVEYAIARALRGMPLGGEELRDVCVALGAAQASVRRIRASEAPVLQARCAGAVSLGELVARIDHAIGERGEVLDRASPALARIRKSAAQAYDDARARCQAILRSSANANAIQDAIVTMRGGRFVIPVKAEFNGKIPGVVHDASSTGQTLFIEPLAALEVNNRVRRLRVEEEFEVARVLAELSSLVGAHAEAVERNLEILADIDLILARAHLAESMRAVAPIVTNEPHLEIKNGRHPLLGERAIAQSLALDEDIAFIIVSGPNMGGKTISLKMTGLFVAMTACGMHIPADEGTTIGFFTRLGADIGDEQSIAENASTFSAHLARLRELIDGADRRTLVLIDEIARGTEPASSAALGIALLEHLLACGARGIVTTHASELKLFAHDRSGVCNASVRFDPKTYRPTFELDHGAPGRSLAFPLARTIGLPDSVIDRAQTLLSEGERDYDRALAELAQVRAQGAIERDALAEERAHLRILEESARRRADALERERRVLAQGAEEKLTRVLRDFTVELERRASERVPRARVTPGQSALLNRVIDEVHRDLGLRPKAQTVQEKARVSVGDLVHLEAFGNEGTVVEDYGDTVLIAVGSMKSVTSKRHVRVIQRGGGECRQRSMGQDSAVSLDAAAGASREVDVRGMRHIEAEPLVDRWIDEAVLLGISDLRLIHGKGTGLLGRGLQQFLKAHDAVKSVRYGNADEGGGGVTIVELR
jgi:DNA mismatch repair protein MutS2